MRANKGVANENHPKKKYQPNNFTIFCSCCSQKWSHMNGLSKQPVFMSTKHHTKMPNHFKCNTRSHHNFCKNFAGLLSFFGQFGKSYSTMSGRYESPRTCTFLAGESEQLVCLLRIAHFPIDPVDMYACICMSCIYISTSVHTSVYTNKCTNGRKKTQIYLR